MLYAPNTKICQTFLDGLEWYIVLQQLQEKHEYVKKQHSTIEHLRYKGLASSFEEQEDIARRMDGRSGAMLIILRRANLCEHFSRNPRRRRMLLIPSFAPRLKMDDLFLICKHFLQWLLNAHRVGFIVMHIFRSYAQGTSCLQQKKQHSFTSLCPLSGRLSL